MISPSSLTLFVCQLYITQPSVHRRIRVSRLALPCYAGKVMNISVYSAVKFELIILQMRRSSNTTTKDNLYCRSATQHWLLFSNICLPVPFMGEIKENGEIKGRWIQMDMQDEYPTGTYHFSPIQRIVIAEIEIGSLQATNVLFGGLVKTTKH